MSVALQRFTRPIVLLNCILAFPAGLSLATGMRKALHQSQDFQWSGAHLLALGIDPYLEQIRLDPGHLIVKTQLPNYLHVLYLLLWPLGELSLNRASAVWVVLNLFFAVISVVLLGRIFRLRAERTILLGLLLAISTPLHIALGNGQQSLLEMVFLVLALWMPSEAALPLSFSYFKYSFSPPIVFYLFFRRAWRLLALSAIVPVVAWLIFWWRVGGSPIRTMLEPFQVAGHSGVGYGDGDVTTVVNLSHPGHEHLSVLAGLVVGIVFAYVIYRQHRPLPEAGVLLAVLSLGLLPHLTYDYVLLAVPAAYLLSRRPEGTAWFVSATAIVIFWYLFRLFPYTLYGYLVYVLVHMVLLIVLGLSLAAAVNRVPHEPLTVA